MRHLISAAMACLTIALGVIAFAADANPAGQAAPKIEEKPRVDVPGSFGKFDSTVVGAVRQATTGREEDPLKYLTLDMSDIVTDLEAYQTGKPTQDKQTKVVQRLDALIKLLDDQVAMNGSRSGANPTIPLNHSQIMGGPGGGTVNSIKEGDKKWGDLPPKQRDQILQSKTEGFPQGYENILQSYYKRLSQPQVLDETTGSAAPTTAPSK